MTWIKQHNECEWSKGVGHTSIRERGDIHSLRPSKTINLPGYLIQFQLWHLPRLGLNTRIEIFFFCQYLCLWLHWPPQQWPPIPRGNHVNKMCVCVCLFCYFSTYPLICFYMVLTLSFHLMLSLPMSSSSMQECGRGNVFANVVS